MHVQLKPTKLLGALGLPLICQQCYIFQGMLMMGQVGFCVSGKLCEGGIFVLPQIWNSSK